MINGRNFLIFFLSINFFILHGSDLKEADESVTKFATQTLLIFIDDQEQDENYPIVLEFMAALRQKPCPILSSYYILYNIFSGKGLKKLSENISQEPKDDQERKIQEKLKEYKQRYDLVLIELKKLLPNGKELNEKEQDEIAQKLNKLFPALKPHEIEFQFGYKIFLEETVLEFNPDRWIIKYYKDKKNNKFVLLIPKDLPEIKDYKENPKVNGDTLTPFELKIGLKMDHLESVSADKFKAFVSDYTSTSKSLKNAFINMIWDNRKESPEKAHSNIFVTKDDYKKNKIAPKDRPQWAFYMTGHGSLAEYVAGVNIHEFNDLITFFDTAIHTKILVYSTCMASGLTQEQLYAAEKNRLAKDHSYVIAFEGVAEESVIKQTIVVSLYGFERQFIDFKNKKISLGVSEFDEFARRVKYGLDYKFMLSPILYGLQNFFHVSLLPQIKVPHMPWFTITDITNATVTISPILARARDKIDVATYFKRISAEQLAEQAKETKEEREKRLKLAKEKPAKANPAFIFFNAHMIPHLVIDTDKRPEFLSLFPGQAIQFITKISSAQYAIEDLFKSFNHSGEAPKTFWILEMETKPSGLDPLKGKNKIHDVVISLYKDEHNKDKFDIFFMHENNYYSYNTEKNTIEPTSNYFNEWVDYTKKHFNDSFFAYAQENVLLTPKEIDNIKAILQRLSKLTLQESPIESFSVSKPESESGKEKNEQLLNDIRDLYTKLIMKRSQIVLVDIDEKYYYDREFSLANARKSTLENTYENLKKLFEEYNKRIKETRDSEKLSILLKDMHNLYDQFVKLNKEMDEFYTQWQKFANK